MCFFLHHCCSYRFSLRVITCRFWMSGVGHSLLMNNSTSISQDVRNCCWFEQRSHCGEAGEEGPPCFSQGGEAFTYHLLSLICCTIFRNSESVWVLCVRWSVRWPVWLLMRSAFSISLRWKPISSPNVSLRVVLQLGGTNSEKRCYKLAKQRLGTHRRAQAKREEIKSLYAKMRARAAQK